MGCGLALLLAALGCRLSAQSAAAAWIATIQQSQGSAEVRAGLRELWQADSTQLYKVGEEAMAAMERPDGRMTRPQADTLLRLVRIGRAHDPGGAGGWIVAQALLGMRQEEHFGPMALHWAWEAMETSPDQVPVVLVREVCLRLAVAPGGDWEQGARRWALMEGLMQRRSLAGGAEGRAWAREWARAAVRMRAALPDCGQVLARWGEPVARGELGEEACRAFLVLYALQGCDQAGLWEAAWNKVAAASDTPLLHRMAGAEALGREDWESARGQWLAAAAMEQDSVFRAADMRVVAATWRQQEKFREAKLALQEAMRLRPEWGETYLDLIDLYLHGAEECNWPEFEGRAIYWLLMELCQRLKAADPSLAAEADARYLEYARQAPTLKQANHLGWQPGDTYPIKCWMNTATVVPQVGL